MPKLKLAAIIAGLFIAIMGSTFAKAETITKDGREYTYDLKNRLGIEQAADLDKVFEDLRQNLPKQDNLESMAAGLDAIAKIAVAACSYAGYFEQNWTDLDGLYQAMLDRPPTDKERATAVRDSSGNLEFFPNCFILAMHPEFITGK